MIPLHSVSLNKEKGEITFDSITVSMNLINLEILEEDKRKKLIITYDNEKYVWESAPRSILRGQDKIADMIDKIRHDRYSAFENARQNLVKEAKSNSKNKKTYGFLIKSLHPLKEVVAGGLNMTPFDNDIYHVSTLSMSKCNIRGHRYLVVSHPTEKVLKDTCEFIRNFFGDTIVQEGEMVRVKETEVETNGSWWKFK